MKLPVDPLCSWGFVNVQRSDFEVHIPRAYADTPEGHRLLDRCDDGGIQAVISGIDGHECDEILLRKCDYIIDTWTTMLADSTQYWYWNTVWAGKRQDNMLTNPKYDVSKHDVSKTRLQDRYSGYGWKHSSGGYHGNGNWQCRGCGGKCKRGRCRVMPGKEQLDLPDDRLPEKGSKEWLSLTVEDICERYRWQKASGKHVVENTFVNSIDTFSSD
ncbi:Nn.00g073710.m01.CDS01 [Neocucurbitaria sp. VM-36]